MCEFIMFRFKLNYLNQEPVFSGKKIGDPAEIGESGPEGGPQGVQKGLQ